ncbi:ComEC/Rec2 family competence protein [Flavobacteriaceae bacterium GF1]
MRFSEFVSVKLTLCLVLGIILGYYIQPKIEFIAVALIVLIALLGFIHKLQKRASFPFFGPIAFLTTTLIGMLIIGFSSPKNQPNHYLKVSGLEKTLQLKITQALKPNTYSHRYFARVESIDGKRSSGTLILYVTRDSLTRELAVDDEVLSRAVINPVPPSLNPYQFDFKDYLRKQGVYGQIQISGHEFLKLKDPSPSLRGIAANFRLDVITKLQKQPFGKEQLGVIQALLLGQRNDISEGTYDNYKNAGAVHILAVSGLHVGILLVLLQFLLQPLERFRRGKTLKLIIIVALLWSYAFVAGLSPSIVRAVTMFSFLAYALYLNRPTNTFNILALSMFFILLIKPLFLFQVGFQMSYAAVFAIVWMYPKLQQFWFPNSWLVRKGWQLLSVSIAAQLGVLSLSLFYFHQFPALFFVSNLIVVPFLGIILGFGILVLALVHFDLLPPFLVAVYDALIGGMNAVIAWVAQQEAFLFRDIPFDAVQMGLTCLMIIGLVHFLSSHNFKNLTVLLTALMIYCGYLFFEVWTSHNHEKVWLLHQNKNSIVLHQQGQRLNVLTRDPDKTKRLVRDYTIAQRISSVHLDTLQNNYQASGEDLLVLDGTGVYTHIKMPRYVLLTQSPKIHLGRFIDSVRPKMILADGSNYKSIVRKWQETCKKRKLPFHYTGEKGAYPFIFED